MSDKRLTDLVTQAIIEDLPEGDLTTDALDLGSKHGKAKLIAKQDLVLSGSDFFEEAFRQIDAATQIQWSYKDGQKILKGASICTLTGKFSNLLKGERVALNFLGHFSGIATLTNLFVEKTKGTQTRILDTRKTTPGLRIYEKRAVTHGGGKNHRMNLSDGILIKENHIRSAGSIKNAMHLVRKRYKNTHTIEVEVANLDEIAEALESGADRLLFDNMPNELIAQGVALVNRKVAIEVSGNMTLDRINSVAKLGVDYISVGALTHSAPWVDVSLLFDF